MRLAYIIIALFGLKAGYFIAVHVLGSDCPGITFFCMIGTAAGGVLIFWLLTRKRYKV